jgi:SAM-dependent methyltransferase
MSFDASSRHRFLRDVYDKAAEAYARKFLQELDHKPFDRELLKEFAALVGQERAVLDLGCGPGHTTAHLAALGVRATGVDLSPNMVETARGLFPETRFEVGDFFALDCESSSIAGILAFYCIVHLSLDQLVPAFVEWQRVLEGGGVLLLSFHVGSEVVRAENFLGTNSTLDFTFFDPEQVKAALLAAGFEAVDVRIRAPYEIEYPSERSYVFARKPQSAMVG